MPSDSVDSAKPATSERGAPAAKVSRRGPGRPSGARQRTLDREVVLAVAFGMTRSVPVDELSIVRVARELDVTPALIHYYLAGGGRDALTSGIMNAFYRELVERWPAQTGDWRHNVEVMLDAIYRAYLRYPGVCIYAASSNKYQLVQDVQPGETDYGLLMLEAFNRTVRQGGFDAAHCGSLAHLLMQFVQSHAFFAVTRRLVGPHSCNLQARLAAVEPDRYPNCRFISDSVPDLNAAEAFTVGLRIVLDGLEAWLPA